MRYHLPEITYPLSIDTIGKQIALGYEVHASCEQCHHSGRLNMVRLAYKLGFGHNCLSPAIRPHVVCGQCGAKEMGFVLSPPTYCSSVNNRKIAGYIWKQ